MDDVNVNHEVSDAGYSARVRFRGLVRCMGRMGLWFHLRFGSEVWATVRLNGSVTLRHG